MEVLDIDVMQGIFDPEFHHANEAVLGRAKNGGILFAFGNDHHYPDWCKEVGFSFLWGRPGGASGLLLLSEHGSGGYLSHLSMSELVCDNIVDENRFALALIISISKKAQVPFGEFLAMFPRLELADPFYGFVDGKRVEKGQWQWGEMQARWNQMLKRGTVTPVFGQVPLDRVISAMRELFPKPAAVG